MITTFEEITVKLSSDEMKILPIMVNGFNCHVGSTQVITSEAICQKLNEYIRSRGLTYSHNFKITGVRIRKMVHYIVLNRLTKLPLIANSKGYYITDNKEEISLHLQSLQDRQAAIQARHDAVKFWVINKK